MSKQRARLPDDERASRRKASALAYYYRNRGESLAYKVKYDREHKEHRAAYGKAYDAANAERIKERKKVYRLANKERRSAKYQEKKVFLQAQMAAYYVANAVSILARVKAWAHANPEKVRIYGINERARKRANGGKLSPGLPASLLALQRGLCACCRGDLNTTGYHLDHIEPLVGGGAHENRNIQLLCPDCNQCKHAKHPVDFMQSRGYLL